MSLLESPTSMRDDVVDTVDSPRPNDSGIAPVPSSFGTLNDVPSVETSSPVRTPSKTALKLLVT